MIDWERVRILHDDLGSDGVETVMAIFTEDARMLLAQIASAISAPAQEADFHRLRGGALNMGCAALAEACRRSEAQARAGTLVTPADVAVLLDLCEGSLRALERGAPAAATGL